MKESDKKDNEKMNNELMGSNHQTTKKKVLGRY